MVLLPLLLSHFSCVRLCATPQTAATRLPHPWDSPGKNTGVGCHFLLQCMKVKGGSEVTQSCSTLSTTWTAAYQAPPSMGFSRQEYWSGLPLNGAPLLIKISSNMTPINTTLFGNKVFADVLKMRSHWSRVTLHPIRSKKPRQTRGLQPCDIRGRDHSAAAGSQGTQGRLVNTRGWKERFSPGASRESIALPAPGFGTYSLQKRVTINSCFFTSPSLQCFVTAALETDTLA